MNEVLRNVITNLIAIDEYTQIVVFCSVVTALWLVRSMTESTALTVLFAPAILFGALAANYLFRVNFIAPTIDKDTNVVVASAVGVLLALTLMLIASRIAILMTERKSSARANQYILTPGHDLGHGGTQP